MRRTRTTALVFAAVTLAATAASPSPAAAFFFPIGLFLGPPRAVTVNPHRGPYTVKPGKTWTGTRSRDEDSKPGKVSTRTSSKDDESKWSSKSGKGAKSATKAEANANSGHGGRQTQRRWSVEHDEPSASKTGANSDKEGASLTGIGDFDESLGKARMDDSVQLPPK